MAGYADCLAVHPPAGAWRKRISWVVLRGVHWRTPSSLDSRAGLNFNRDQHTDIRDLPLMITPQPVPPGNRIVRSRTGVRPVRRCPAVSEQPLLIGCGRASSAIASRIPPLPAEYG
jgi:hypothetical protein